jgi:hypothetical protein
MTKAELEQLKKESEGKTVFRVLIDGKEGTIAFTRLTDIESENQKLIKENETLKKKLKEDMEKWETLYEKTKSAVKKIAEIFGGNSDEN